MKAFVKGQQATADEARQLKMRVPDRRTKERLTTLNAPQSQQSEYHTSTYQHPPYDQAQAQALARHNVAANHNVDAFGTDAASIDNSTTTIADGQEARDIPYKSTINPALVEGSDEDESSGDDEDSGDEEESDDESDAGAVEIGDEAESDHQLIDKATRGTVDKDEVERILQDSNRSHRRAQHTANSAASYPSTTSGGFGPTLPDQRSSLSPAPEVVESRPTVKWLQSESAPNVPSTIGRQTTKPAPEQVYQQYRAPHVQDHRQDPVYADRPMPPSMQNEPNHHENFRSGIGALAHNVEIASVRKVVPVAQSMAMPQVPIEQSINNGQTYQARPIVQDGLDRLPNRSSRMKDPSMDRSPTLSSVEVQHMATEGDANGIADLDYEPEELYKLTYERIKKESFDFGPSCLDPNKDSSEPLENRLTAVSGFGMGAEQTQLFTTLTIDEWEEAGDWFHEQFSNVMGRLKQARRKKRKLALDYESEIEKRHEAVLRKRQLTDDALQSIKDNGGKVLQGTPRKR